MCDVGEGACGNSARGGEIHVHNAGMSEKRKAEIYRPIIVDNLLERLERWLASLPATEKRSRQNAVNYALSVFLKGKGY